MSCAKTPRPAYEASDQDRSESRAFFGANEDPISSSILNATLPYLLARVRAEALAAGVEKERARIVAWLRRGADPARRQPDDPWYMDTPGSIAAKLEAGRHE